MLTHLVYQVVNTPAYSGPYLNVVSTLLQLVGSAEVCLVLTCSSMVMTRRANIFTSCQLLQHQSELQVSKFWFAGGVHNLSLLRQACPNRQILAG